MSILNVNAVDISENNRASKVVELMLKKPIAIISKGELVRMIVAQYSAIQALVEALSQASPGHPLLPLPRPDNRNVLPNSEGGQQ